MKATPSRGLRAPSGAIAAAALLMAVSAARVGSAEGNDGPAPGTAKAAKAAPQAQGHANATPEVKAKPANPKGHKMQPAPTTAGTRKIEPKPMDKGAPTSPVRAVTPTKGQQMMRTPAPGPGKRATREQALSHYAKARRALDSHQNAKSDEDKQAFREAKREMAHARAEILEARHREIERFNSMSKEQRSGLDYKLGARMRVLSSSRKERQQRESDRIKTLLGEKAKTEEVRKELKDHAWRVARIQHLLLLARARGASNSAERADELLAQENARHAKQLSTLTGKKIAAAAVELDLGDAAAEASPAAPTVQAASAQAPQAKGSKKPAASAKNQPPKPDATKAAKKTATQGGE